MGEVSQITSGILKVPTQFFLTQTERDDSVVREFAEKERLGNPGKRRRCSRRQLPKLIELYGSRQFQLVSESFRHHLQGQQSLFRYTYCYFDRMLLLSEADSKLSSVPQSCKAQRKRRSIG